ncbi:MAG: hypothetical protein LBT40_02795 [Deltaproteobacteria bacterium]|jgi:Fe-S cluster assembly iron-binding protein IscA|nr:hypothetical protein [Deltaproteobacteria bacterium]
MITITPEASRRLVAFLESRNAPLSVRVFASKGSCGPAGGLSITVDAPGPDDWAGPGGGLTLLMEKGLMDQTGNVIISYGTSGKREGFTVTPEKELPLPEGCSACATPCSH